MTTYKIKRFSWINKEKLFSGREAKYLAVPVYEEIIKIVEFWQAPPPDSTGLGGRDTPHWLNILTGILRDALGLKDKPQWMFLPLEKNRQHVKVKSPLSQLRDSVLGKKPVELIEEAMTRLEGEKVNGKLKYKELLDSNGGFTRSPEDYIHIIKYLSLSLTLGYSESDYRTVEKSQIDYDISVGLGETELRKTLERLFLEILGPNSKIKY